MASQNLSKLNIQNRIAELKAEQVKRLQINADDTLKEIWYNATVDPKLMYDENKKFLDIPDMPEEIRRAIAGFKVKRIVTEYDSGEEVTEFTFDVKLNDKSKNLDMMMRHHSLYNDKITVNGLGATKAFVFVVPEPAEFELAPDDPIFLTSPTAEEKSKRENVYQANSKY